MSVEDGEYVIENNEWPSYPIPEATLGTFLYDSLLSNTTSHEAMLDAFSGETISYKALLEQSCSLAEALRKYGCTTETVVSICSENSLKFFIPVLASIFAGIIMAPLNHFYTEDELKHVLAITEPKIIFCSEIVSSRFLELKQELGFIEKIIIIDADQVEDGAVNMRDFVAEQLLGNTTLPNNFQPYNKNANEQVAFVMFSSGTTGVPKGVMLTHRNMMIWVAVPTEVDNSWDANSTILGLTPFFHGYGLNSVLMAIVRGSRVIVLRRFDEDIFLKSIQDFRISILALAPPLAIFLAKSPKLDDYDLSSVSDIWCGAAPLSKETENALKNKLKVKNIRQAYGLTEANLAVTVVKQDVNKPGSCGAVVPFAKIIIRDPETGKSLGSNHIGEICVKSPQVMKGYYGNEKATKMSFTPDGWLRTGDLAYYDEEHYFYIVDRLKELIKYKGYQVAPAELESVLLSHPKVADVGVVGLPDELAGELPVAFVVKQDNVEVTEAEIQEFVAGKVSPQKKLRGGVIFVDYIPRNLSGKILRKDLRSNLREYKAQRESKL